MRDIDTVHLEMRPHNGSRVIVLCGNSITPPPPCTPTGKIIMARVGTNVSTQSLKLLRTCFNL